jgi:hypothetical protein
MSSTATACPWAVGDRVVLRSPNNAHHPRKGRIGTVVRVRWFDEAVGFAGVVKSPAMWMAVVRFDRIGEPDGFDKLGVGAEWRVFEGELAIIPKGRVT